MAAELMLAKAHQTLEGLHKIVAIKATINTGLSKTLQKAFPNIIEVSRPLIDTSVIPSGEWVAGFTTGDGSFDIQMPKSKSNKVEFLVQVRFRLTQHIRDKKLFMLLIEYFNCGRIENYYKSGQAIDFVVTGFKNINSVIIPFVF